LWSWMQQSTSVPKHANKELPFLHDRQVDRVIVHVEQMSFKHSWGKELSIKLGELLQQSVADVNNCIVKLSQANIHRATGPLFSLGSKIIDDLKLVAPTYKSTSSRQSGKTTTQTASKIPSKKARGRRS